MKDDLFLFQKNVDRSVLYQGMSIKNDFQTFLFDKIGYRLNHGEKADIQIMIDGKLFSAELINLDFDRNVYIGHKDILQIRYTEKSGIPEKMREIFKKTYKTVLEYEEKRFDKSHHLYIPDNDKEYVVFYSTPQKGVLMMDYICKENSDYCNEAEEIKKYDEREIELLIDNDAYISEKSGIVKIRHMSRAVGNSLKLLYGYRCQICGEFIGEKYGSHLIHAHHIEYFTKSLNNNADNIMILCPNHHGIIHDMEPIFNRQELEYDFPNGYTEKIKIDKHLRPGYVVGEQL